MRWTVGAFVMLLPAMAAAQADDHLTVGVRAPIVTLDPALSGLGPMHGYYTNIYDSLIGLDEQSHLVPQVATSWRLVDDLTWEFKLRAGVKCHDGSTLDAASVKSSLDRLPNVPNSDNLTAGKLRQVRELQVVDPLTIRMVTSQPYPALLSALPDFHLVCASVPATATTTDFDSGKDAIGSGPYRSVRWQRGQGWELERFDGYWGPKPAFARVTLREIPNDAARMASLQAGDIQLADYIPPLDVKRLSETAGLGVFQTASNRSVFLGFDELRDQTPFATDKAGAVLPRNPFRDERVRRAFALAISQDVIVKRVMEGLAETTTQGVPTHIAGYDAGLAPTAYQPDTAKKLLAEAGYPDGFNVTLHCPNDRYVNDAASCQTVGVLLARVGVTVAIDAQPSSVYFPRLQRREYSFYLLAWGSNGGDATSFLRDVMETRDASKGVGSWNMGQSLPDLDAAIDVATLTMDEAARNRAMAAIMGELIRRQVYIPLDTLLVIAAARKPVTYLPQASEELILSAVRRP